MLCELKHIAGSERFRRWGAPRSVTSEYRTFSRAHVKVYKDGRRISTTDTGVRTHGNS